MNQNNNFTTLDQKKKELTDLKAEWEGMKKEEGKLKEQFYNSSFAEKARLKSELTNLQEKIFKKKEAGILLKISIEKEESLQSRNNQHGNPTDPKKLAESIKANLKEILASDKKPKRVFGDYWEISRGEEIWAFTKNEEIKKMIENLPRHRGSKEEIVNDIKPSDLGQADYDEILKLVRRVREFWLEKDKQEREAAENKLKNYNSALFSCYKCSTDPDYNGIGHWQSWHNFSGYYNGIEYNIMVPDNHVALTNILLNDGWGTNSEIKNFYVVEGVATPTELYCWNQAKQKDEIVSETEAQRTGKKVCYKKIIDLNDKITIRHYDEKSDKAHLGIVEGRWSGVNKELAENNNHKNGGAIVASLGEKENPQLENNFLLKYFQENDIKQIELTPKGNLLFEYNSGKSEIITNEQVNQLGMQKVISYYQENSQTKLSQQDLINLTNSNSAQPKNTNNNLLLISFGLGGALIIGLVVGLWLRKSEVKKH